jgi:hypothetical protein
MIGLIKKKKEGKTGIDYYGVQIFAYATHYDVFNTTAD